MSPTRVPSEPPITTAVKPTSSEIRAPMMRRLKMSRPSGSVPSQWTIPSRSVRGGSSRFSTRTAFGDCGATHTPPIAPRMTRISRAAPLTAPGDRRNDRSMAADRVRGDAAVSAPGPPMESGSVRCVGGGWRLSEPDSWVEVSIGEIDEQVERHEDGGDDDHGSLDNGEVLLIDGVHDQPADSRPREDRLRNDGAA